MSFRKSQFEDSDDQSGFNPATLLIIISLWIAVIGNGALWEELQQMGGLRTASDFWVAICLSLVI